MLNHAELDLLLNAAADAGDVAGAVAAVSDRERTIYQHGAGLRRLGRSAPMSVDSVCAIASMSKPITATAAVLLLEENKLHLDQPAGEIIPALYDARVLSGFDAAGEPQTRPPARPITLRHLLTHTCGFANETWSADTGRCITAAGPSGSDERYAASLQAPLMHDPGERWWYSMGVDWAGRLIEAASGESLGKFLRQRLFSPLGMHDTSFRLNPVLRDRLATIHSRGNARDNNGSGELEPLSAEPPDVPRFERGGGGLYSTAADYLAFIRLFLNDGNIDGEPLLSPASLALLRDNQIGALRVEKLIAALPQRSNDMEIFPGVEKTWSLAFMRNEQPAPTGRPAGSLAWAGINNTYCWIDLENRIGGVFMSQTMPFLDVKAAPLALAFERAVYRQLGV